MSKDIAGDPGPWELLARRARDGGVHGLATEIQTALWEAGVRSADVALDLARHEMSQGQDTKAVYFLTEAFGAQPEDSEARVIYAHAIARKSPDKVIDLLRQDDLTTLDDAVLLIDALRSTDQYKRALDVVSQGLAKAPGEPRLLTRKARLLEALNRWEDALEVWNTLSQGPTRLRSGALLSTIRLNLRLERPEDALDAASRQFAAASGIVDVLAAAEMLGLDGIVCKVVAKAQRWSATGQMPQVEVDRVAGWLLDRGALGLLAWLDGRAMGFGREVRESLRNALAPHKKEALADGTVEDADALRSPEYLLPFTRGFLEQTWNALEPVAHDGSSHDAILIVNATLAAGGAERQLLALADALINAGIAAERLHFAFLTLIADRGHAHFLPALEQLGVHVHDLRKRKAGPAALPAILQTPVNLLPIQLRHDVLAIWQLAYTLRPQVLHGWQDRSAMACGFVGTCMNIERIVLSARNMQPQKRGDFPRYTKPLLQALCERPNVVMSANSEEGARDYEDWLGLREGKVEILRNGLKTRVFELARSTMQRQRQGKPWPRPSNEEVVLGGVFRLAANKRPALWLQTVAQLARIAPFRVRPRIVGSGPFESEIHALAEELGLANLQIDGALSAPEDIYGGMDALLLMSRVEGTPNVLLEAQALGIPAAACDVGGVRQVLCPGALGKGLLLQPDVSPEHAAQQLCAWLPGALSGGADARSAFVEREFGLQALGRRVLGLYARNKNEISAAH